MFYIYALKLDTTTGIVLQFRSHLVFQPFLQRLRYLFKKDVVHPIELICSNLYKFIFRSFFDKNEIVYSSAFCKLGVSSIVRRVISLIMDFQCIYSVFSIFFIISSLSTFFNKFSAIFKFINRKLSNPSVAKICSRKIFAWENYCP